MYIVEGNIGAGKSTFLKLVGQRCPHISVGLEPLNNWHSEKDGQSLLQLFYDYPTRWAFTLETLAMMSRIKEHQLEQRHESVFRVVERSIYSGYYCFGCNSYQSGFLTDIEWSMYQDWFKFLTRDDCDLPQGFIYLRVDPVVAFERTKKRNRSAESGLTLEYLEQIDKLHNEFLINKSCVDGVLKDVPVLVLDCNAEFEAYSVRLEGHIQKLDAFLFETQRADLSDMFIKQHDITF